MAYLDKSLKGKRWTLASCEDRDILYLSRRYNLLEPIARLLIQRGVEPEDVPSFMNPRLKESLPDPWHLKDMDQAVPRLYQALMGQEKVGILADYDVDGATSAALLMHYFKALGISYALYIPDRLREGYGPNAKALESLQRQGCTLIITLDCGTTAFDALDHGKTLGLDVIVIDHHHGEPKHPSCLALINPNRIDQRSPLTTLAAVGVTFVTLVAFNQFLRQKSFDKKRPLPNLLTFLDLVALGTVCDVVPLKGLNRAFVAQGLKVLGHQKNRGLQVLTALCGIQGPPSAGFLGFQLGPRINAGGRVGQSSLGAQLLTTEDTSQAEKWAQTLNHYNDERRQLEADVLEAALVKVPSKTPSGLVILGENWHPGVIGIVASRLKDLYHRPTFVLTQDATTGEIKGSGRSVTGFHMGTFIQRCKQKGLLLAGGGHGMAAGLTMTPEKLSAFEADFIKAVDTSECSLTPCLHFEGFLSPDSATEAFLDALEALAPFGQGHPTPKFVIEHVSIENGILIGENHLKGTLVSPGFKKRLEVVAFRALDTPLASAFLDKKGGRLYAALGTVQRHVWQGYCKPQFILEDLALMS